MTPITFGSAVVVSTLLLLFPGRSIGADPPIDQAATPESMVRSALESELVGPSPLRQKLLDAALKRDDDLAAAQWAAGNLKWGGHWMNVDDVSLGSPENKTLVEYRRRRDNLISTAKEHRELAAWCAQHDLADEARLHWTKVLQFGEDSQALAALHLQGDQGRLLAPDERQRQKQKLEEQRWAQKTWLAPIKEIRNSILRGSKQEVADAHRQLAQITDPNAIPALAEVFFRPSQKGPLAAVFLETMARMHGPQATAALLQVAVFHTSPHLRQVALDALKKRPKYAIVPLLLAGLQRPVDSVTTVRVAADGTVTRNHLVRLRGWMDDVIMQSERQLFVVGKSNARTTSALLTEAAQGVAEVQREVALARARAEAINAPIQAVLAQVMETEDPSDPISWYRRWLEYSEYDVPDYPHEIYHQYYVDMQYRAAIADVPPLRPRSCFAAGTMVTTLLGQRPIESIKAGDRVLAQDPDSGELAFQLVQEVTTRPPTPMVKIGLGADTIRATRGHFFWVNGSGWVMAKELKLGMLLHGLRGAVVIDSVEPASDREAYNLVVGGTNTYFVGDSRLLVHDNMPPLEPATVVPGLAAPPVTAP